MSYGMYTPAGDHAVALMVARLLKLPISTGAKDLDRALTAEFNAVAKVHPEVWDTEVREAVIGRLERETGRSLSIYF
jgi:hypothetical protein